MFNTTLTAFGSSQLLGHRISTYLHFMLAFSTDLDMSWPNCSLVFTSILMACSGDRMDEARAKFPPAVAALYFSNPFHAIITPLSVQYFGSGTKS